MKVLVHKQANTLELIN